jgi:hypothetical protein
MPTPEIEPVSTIPTSTPDEAPKPPPTPEPPSSPETVSGGAAETPAAAPPAPKSKLPPSRAPRGKRTPNVEPPRDMPPPPSFVTAPMPPATSAAPASSPATVTEVLADPQGLAEILIVGLDGAAVAIGKWRYGSDSPTLRARDDGKREIKRAAVAYLTAMGTHMTPGQALMAAIAAAYLPTVLEWEIAGVPKP